MSRGDLFELTLSQTDGQIFARAKWLGQRAEGQVADDMGAISASVRPPSEAATPTPRGIRRRVPSDSPTETSRQIGERLFTALPETVRHLWSLARQRGVATGERLHFRLAAVPALAPLPWELLCEPGGAFVAASAETSMSRCVEPTRPEPLARPDSSSLRILVFATSPLDLDPLDVGGEVERIRQALPDRRDGRVRVDVVAGGDRESLLRCLREAPPDVVHWIGHGVRDADHGGLLLVESPDGGSESIRPEQLAEMLRHGPSLVVLATCHSADSGGGDFLGAAAPGLARAGVPAVVAMRDAIRDQDALRFTQTLYKSLATGEDIAAAVATARLELLLREVDDAGSWAIPVLYERHVQSELSSWRIPLPRRRRRILPAALVAALVVVGTVAAWRWTPDPVDTSGPVDPAIETSAIVNEPRPFLSTHDPRCPAVPGLDLSMIYVEPGSFDMGSTVGETDERPVHRVTLRDPFCLGRYEVTVAQWNVAMPDDALEMDDELPASKVSWDDAVRFIGELNRRVPERPFRLPTEAEWEYAARAGTDTVWSFGDDVTELLRHGNCKPETGTDGFEGKAPVGSLLPNPWGFYDLHGNVTEWVADGYGPYPEGPVVDPRGPEKSEEKVRRGGNYLTKPENCSSSRRYATPAKRPVSTTGFRLAANPN